MPLDILTNMRGGGKDTVGGAQSGQVTVPITSLADSTSPGTLRYFLETMGSQPRVADLQVSGLVELSDQITVGSNLSFIQQGTGHKLRVNRARLRFAGSEVIMEGMNHLCGNNITGKNLDSVGDCYSIGAQPNRVHNVYFRNMTADFAVDENMSIWGENYDITLEYCASCNALDEAGHSKVRHSMGLLIGFNDSGTPPHDISVISCFFHNNDQRNALIKDKSNKIEFINNVISNAGRAGMTFKEAQIHAYGNIVKRGLNSGAIDRMFQTDGNSYSKYHLRDNFEELSDGSFIPLLPSSSSKVVNSQIFTPNTPDYIETPADIIQEIYDNVIG